MKASVKKMVVCASSLMTDGGSFTENLSQAQKLEPFVS